MRRAVGQGRHAGGGDTEKGSFLHQPYYIYCTIPNTPDTAAGGEVKNLAVSKGWKLTGWGGSFLKTDWLAQEVQFPTLSSLLYTGNHSPHITL